MSRIICNIIVISIFLFPFVQASVLHAEGTRGFTVVIDAGHGGKDVGATDNGVMEKNINLKVAKQLESIIKKKMKDANVVMTRDNDSYLTLQERADIANKAQGDIFVSIHTNSVSKRNKNRKSLEGSSVYTLGLHKDENNLEVAMRENSVIELEKDYEQKYSGFDPQRDESYIIFEMAQKQNLNQSIHLADNLEKELVSAGRQSRGIHQAGFWVLWSTSMPSVLVELDFICNPKSAKYLASDRGAKELAEALYKGISAYEKNWKKKVSAPTYSVSHSQEESKEIFSENLEKPLDDTYVELSSMPVTKAKKRAHVENKIVNNTGARKRRSQASKLKSLNQSYEKDDLVFTGVKSYSTSSERINDNEKLLASATVKESASKSKNKKADKDKKKQKEEKKKEQKKKPQRNKDAYNAKVNKLVTVYKIQVLASSDLLNQGNSRFCGLSPISAYKENDLYKYYYGESTDKSELEAVLADVRKKIPDAFIVSSTKSVQSNN